MIWVARISIVAVLLLSWQVASGPLIDPMLIGTPLDTGHQLVEWISDGTLAAAALATIHVVVLGLLLGSAAGIVIGLATGLSRVLAACLEPILTILFALPKIALVPLFILWFGLDSTERVVFTASVVFFLVYLAVFTGVRRIPVSLDNSLRLIGATLPQRLVALYIPGSIGWLIAGLRIAVPYAFLSAVGAEVVGAQEGLGYLIKTSAYSVDPNGMMAAILVLVVLAVGAMAAAEALDRVSRWRL